MKKKVLVPIILTLAAAFACLPLFACTGGGLKLGDNATITIREGAENRNVLVIFTVDAKGIKSTASVKDYMDALKSAGKLAFEGSDGAYGYYIKSVNGRREQVISSGENSREGYSWNLYLDFVKLDGDDAIYASDYSAKELDGKTYYSASYGISGVPCVQGHTYILSYDYYNYSW